MRKEFTDIGEDLSQLWFDSPGQLFDTAPPPMAHFKSEFSYFSICSNYFDYDADLEEEADVNEEGNEDYFASL